MTSLLSSWCFQAQNTAQDATVLELDIPDVVLHLRGLLSRVAPLLAEHVVHE